jgi:hypothetical protein
MSRGGFSTAGDGRKADMDLKSRIAEVFCEHWRIEESLGDETTAVQELIAKRLLRDGYPLTVDDAAIAARREVRERRATLPSGEHSAAQTRRRVPSATAKATSIHDYQWTAVPASEKTGFLEQINPIDGKYGVSPSTTDVCRARLDWYDTVALIRVRDSRWSNAKLFAYYLTDQGNLYRLNGTSPPIHEVNARAPIKLSRSNVLSYLAFFCYFVRGKEGPFYLLESMDDPSVADLTTIPDDGSVLAMAKRVIEGTIRPVTLEGVDGRGHFLCHGAVFYSNAIFFSNFTVQPTGLIEMLDDEPIAADLPYRINEPIS